MNIARNQDATNAAIAALEDADTPLEWAVALMALWLACESEGEFEVELIDHTDLHDWAIAAMVAKMRTGDMTTVVDIASS